MYDNELTDTNRNYILTTKAIACSTETEDTEALNRLIDEYGKDVLKTAYLFVKDTSLADDIFQEVFIKVYKNLHKYRGEASLKTWILQITINQCKDYLKSNWFKRIILNFSDKEEVKVSSSLENIFIDKEEKKQLLNQVLELPILMREVLILYYYHDMNVAEISTALSIPQGTARSRLHRAKELLKNKLQNRPAN